MVWSHKHLVALIVRFTGFKSRVVWDTGMPGGQPRRRLDTSRAERKFTFKVKTPFEVGLKCTIE